MDFYQLHTGIATSSAKTGKTNDFSALKNALHAKGWIPKLDLYRPVFESVEYINSIDSPRISIIVIAWKMNPEILRNLRELQQQRDQRFELIFVANGGESGEFKALRQYADVFVQLKCNTGAYLARNLGSTFSTAPVVMFLDDDALPDSGLVGAHLTAHAAFDVIAVRGAVHPKTENPLNSRALHYDLGDRSFPVYANIEGNVSYRSEIFFRVGGWDDEIRFGGGGVDLARRLVEIEPDLRKQIYYPYAIIHHDFAADREHLVRKQEKQEKSRERLHRKHPDLESFLAAWDLLQNREDLLIRMDTTASAEEFYRRVFAGSKDTLPEDVQVPELIQLAVQSMNSGKFTDAIRILEEALERDPANVEAVLLMRHVERSSWPEFLDIRQERAIRELESSWDTDRRGHVLLKQASFHNAPRVMLWIKRKVAEDFPEKEGPSDDPSRPPLVSFVIPAYNRPRRVRWTFASVLRQTFPRWEAILVDDASTDETPAVLESLQSAHPDRRIKTVLLPQNVGIGAVRNIGVEHASGEYVVLLDSDDTIAPNFLERTLEAAGRYPEAAWIAPLSVQFGDVNRLFGFERFNLRIILQRNQFNITNLLRKDVYQALGGMRKEMREGFVDWEFWIRASVAGYRPAQLPEALFFYHRHQEGVTGGVHSGKERAFRCKRQIIELNPDIYLPFDERESGKLKISPEIPRDFIDRQHLEEALTRPNPLERKHVEAHSNLSRERIEIDTGSKDGFPRTGSVPGSPGTAVTAESMKHTKVLFVCHDFPPYRYAGAQLYAYHLARELISRGVDVRVLYARNRSGISDLNVRVYDLQESSFNGVPVYEIIVEDTHPDIRSNPQYMFDNEQVNRVYRELLQREHFDAIHYHLLYRLGSGLTKVSRELGIPSFATLHDYWLLCAMGHLITPAGGDCIGPESAEKCAACLSGSGDNPPPMDVFLFTRDRIKANRNAIREIDHVLSPSEFLAKVHELYDFPVSAVLPLGWIPVKGTRTRIRGDRLVFGFCGQIVYRKGLDILVGALRNLDRLDWELHIYGKNYQPNYFETIMEIARTHPNIIYKGEFTSDDLPAIYSTLDVAVIPSRRENYPLTLLESLSAGVPVVAADVGGVREMMVEGRDGFIFESENARELSEILCRLLENPEQLDQLRKTIRPGKTIADNAAEIAEMYKLMIPSISHRLRNRRERKADIVSTVTDPELLPLQEPSDQ